VAQFTGDAIRSDCACAVELSAQCEQRCACGIGGVSRARHSDVEHLLHQRDIGVQPTALHCDLTSRVSLIQIKALDAQQLIVTERARMESHKSPYCDVVILQIAMQ
jgi:hypothetical protein